MTDEIKNRRSIRSRIMRWTNCSAQWLRERGATPNDISLFSIICAEIAGIALLLVFFYESNLAIILLLLLAILGIQSRLVCHLLNGMVAVEGGLKILVEPVYDELSDRISDIIIFLGLGYGLWMFEWSAYLGWAASLFSVMTAYIRLLGGSYGLEQQFLGPMAKQQRMAVLTAVAAVAIFVPFYGHWFLYVGLWGITIGSFLTFIWRAYNIIKTLCQQNSNTILPDNCDETIEDIDDHDDISEDFPRIIIDKL